MKPSHEAMKRLYHFLAKTTVPRIIAKRQEEAKQPAA